MIATSIYRRDGLPICFRRRSKLYLNTQDLPGYGIRGMSYDIRSSGLCGWGVLTFRKSLSAPASSFVSQYAPLSVVVGLCANVVDSTAGG